MAAIKNEKSKPKGAPINPVNEKVIRASEILKEKESILRRR